MCLSLGCTVILNLTASHTQGSEHGSICSNQHLPGSFIQSEPGSLLDLTGSGWKTSSTKQSLGAPCCMAVPATCRPGRQTGRQGVPAEVRALRQLLTGCCCLVSYRERDPSTWIDILPAERQDAQCFWVDTYRNWLSVCERAFVEPVDMQYVLQRRDD